MIKANHTYLGHLFFDWYSKLQFRRYFKTINICGDYEPSNKAILIIANHFSWWDGFIQLWLNNKLMKRKFHVIMLEEQLLQFMILNKGGAFSVKKNSRDILESLQYSSEILQDASNLLVIFPQGEIQSLYTTSFTFEKGIEYILRKVDPSQIDILFNVNLVDYLSDKKPTLSIYFEHYNIEQGTSINNIQHHFNKYFLACANKQRKQALQQ